jgi:hypothetical protein
MAEVVVRSYTGANQGEAAVLFAEDAPRLAADGYVPVAQVWVASEWSWLAYLASLVLVIFVIGIFLLVLLGVVKPVRTLMVTYHREPGA